MADTLAADAWDSGLICTGHMDSGLIGTGCGHRTHRERTQAGHRTRTGRVRSEGLRSLVFGRWSLVTPAESGSQAARDGLGESPRELATKGRHDAVAAEIDLCSRAAALRAAPPQERGVKAIQQAG